MKKPRSDSKLDTLPESRVLELRDGLLGGWSYEAALSWLATECGVQSSMAALSAFYKRHCKPIFLQRRQLAALKAEVIAEECGKTDWDSASIESLRQMVFEFMAEPGRKIDDIEKLFRLLLKSRDQETDRRKLAIIERKAQRLDELEAKAREITSGGGLSAETLEVIEKQLKLL